MKVSSLPGASTEPPGEVVGKVWDACVVDGGGGKVGSCAGPGGSGGGPGESLLVRGAGSRELSARPSPSCPHAFP